MLGGEGAQASHVRVAQGFEVPQNQHGDLGPHSDLDLRQAVALVHAADQFAQRHQQPADVGRQHFAAGHVGHVAGLALVETDQDGALLDHVSNRQAGAEAVAPGRALDGTQQRLGAHLAQVPQVVFQDALLHSDLGRRLEVLHLAATAQAEMLTARLGALGALATALGRCGLLPVVLSAADADPHLFAGQGVFDEDHLAVGAVSHALGFEVQGFNGQPLQVERHLGWRGFGARKRNGGCVGHPPIVSLAPQRAPSPKRVSGRAIVAMGRAACPSCGSRSAVAPARHRSSPSRRFSAHA